MSPESNRAIYASIAANVLIAATKFVAGAVTGSSAMLSEGIHSMVDASDGSLLLLGRRRSRRPPDEMHPFGHGKELYFWTLMVAIIFFAVGGGVSVYEGIGRVAHPEPLQDATWSYVVLGIAAALDGSSFAIGYGNFRREAAGRGFWETIVTSKDPSLFTVVLEDAGDLSGIALAFLGIFLGHRLDNPRLDGVAAIGIGLIMAGIATVLTIQSKGLLIGERADVKALARIRAAALEDPVVRAVHRPMTMHLGPHDVLVGLGVEFQPSLTAAELASTIDRLEQRIRQEEPEAKHIYVEAESLKVVEGR